jgi:hypothetical protein
MDVMPCICELSRGFSQVIFTSMGEQSEKLLELTLCTLLEEG